MLPWDYSTWSRALIRPFHCSRAFNCSKCPPREIQTFWDLNPSLFHVTSTYFSNPNVYYSLPRALTVFSYSPPLFFLVCVFICAIPTLLSNDVHILKPNLWIGNRSCPTRKYRSFCELLLKLCSLGHLVLAIYMSCLPLTSLRAETICN